MSLLVQKLVGYLLQMLRRGANVHFIASGGISHWALSVDDDGGVMTIVWGQACQNGELGLGSGLPKSCSKPTRNAPLAGIEIIA